jgi:hypothetical protein
LNVTQTITSSQNVEISSLGLYSSSVAGQGYALDITGGTFQADVSIFNYGTIIITVPNATLKSPSATNFGIMQTHGGLIDFDPLTNWGTMTADSGGVIVVSGATTNLGTMQASSGGELAFDSGLTSTIANASQPPAIYANSGGTVYVAGAASGNGGAFYVNGGYLDLAGSDSLPISFQSGGELKLDQPASFGGGINFGAPSYNPVGDTIDLQNTIITGVYNNGTNLVLTESNGQTLSWQISNLGFNYLTAGSDGAGGTNHVVTAGVPTNLLMRDNNNGALELYALGNNAVLGANAVGAVGLDWQIAGFGGFASHAGEVDMLMRSSNSGAFEVYNIRNNAIVSAFSLGAVGLDQKVAGFGDFSGVAGESDMVLRSVNTGAFEVYDIRNNAIASAAALGAVGLDWQVVGFGDFSGNANETDMMLRNASGAFRIYDIHNNAIGGAFSIGAVGPDWQVAGFGDFNGDGSTDMMLRSVNTGMFELYDIKNNAIGSAAAIGAVGLEWQVLGFSPLGLNPGEYDMLLRDRNNGALEVYDIANNQLTKATSMGAVGLEWQFGGLAVPPASGTSAASMAQLVQATAAFAPSGSAAATDTNPSAGASPQSDQMITMPQLV